MSDGDPANGSTSRKPRFDPTFNLGHVLTMAVIALGVIGSVITLKDGLKEGLLEMRAENKVQDTRIEALGKEATRTASEDVTFRSEVRQSLTQLSGAIADLRVQIANATSAPAPRR